MDGDPVAIVTVTSSRVPLRWGHKWAASCPSTGASQVGLCQRSSASPSDFFSGSSGFLGNLGTDAPSSARSLFDSARLDFARLSNFTSQPNSHCRNLATPP